MREKVIGWRESAIVESTKAQFFLVRAGLVCLIELALHTSKIHVAGQLYYYYYYYYDDGYYHCA